MKKDYINTVNEKLYLRRNHFDALGRRSWFTT